MLGQRSSNPGTGKEKRNECLDTRLKARDRPREKNSIHRPSIEPSVRVPKSPSAVDSGALGVLYHWHMPKAGARGATKYSGGFWWYGATRASCSLYQHAGCRPVPAQSSLVKTRANWWKCVTAAAGASPETRVDIGEACLAALSFGPPSLRQVYSTCAA